jgi:hypothetical protein
MAMRLSSSQTSDENLPCYWAAVHSVDNMEYPSGYHPSAIQHRHRITKGDRIKQVRSVGTRTQELYLSASRRYVKIPSIWVYNSPNAQFALWQRFRQLRHRR